MSDEDKPKLGLRPQLGVKRTTEVSQVKQSFSHGRTKTVVVETKRARPHASPGGNLAAPSARENRVFEPQRPAPQQGGPRPAAPNDGLSAEERAARQRVLEAARARQAQEDAERRAREERARAEAEAAAALIAPEEVAVEQPGE